MVSFIVVILFSRVVVKLLRDLRDSARQRSLKNMGVETPKSSIFHLMEDALKKMKTEIEAAQEPDRPQSIFSPISSSPWRSFGKLLAERAKERIMGKQRMNSKMISAYSAELQKSWTIWKPVCFGIIL